MEQMILTQADNQILKELFREVDEGIKKKLLGMSLWQSADIVNSEVYFGNTYISDGKLYYIDGYLHNVQMVKRPAKAGDIVYITSEYGNFDLNYVGRCFRVCSRIPCPDGAEHSMIKACDTFTEQSHTYFIMLHDEQYLVLKQGDCDDRF